MCKYLLFCVRDKVRYFSAAKSTRRTIFISPMHTVQISAGRHPYNKDSPPSNFIRKTLATSMVLAISAAKPDPIFWV